jgi:cyclophilin family peptidyl-prolyl cis-trans isomerase
VFCFAPWFKVPSFLIAQDGFTTMHYKGCTFHRVVTAYLCQSGDIKRGNGTWSQSIYAHNNPEQKFVDENFILRHAGPGVLSMVNEGPDSNGSGFYIDFVENEQVN